DGATVAFSSNARRPEDMDISLLDVETGKTRSLFGGGKFLIPGAWSPDGSKLTAFEIRQINDVSVHVVDVASGRGEELTPHEGEVRFMPGPWATDGSGFYLLTDEGREYAGLAFQLLDGTREWVETSEGDVET